MLKNALILNLIKIEIDKIPGKNQYGFQRNRSTTSWNLTIRRNIEGVRAKNLETTQVFRRFHTQRDDGVYGLPKETYNKNAALKKLESNGSLIC